MGLPPLFQKNPYPNGNYSVTEDFLEQLILILSGETGQVPILELDNGYEDISVDAISIKFLRVPSAAIAATIAVENDDNQVLNKTRVVRFKINGKNPSSESGIALGDNDIFELKGIQNLKAFRVVGIHKGVKSILRVQYYKSAKQD